MADWTGHLPPRGSIFDAWSGLYLTLFKRPPQITRLVQRAGTGDKPLRYRDGFCVRLPRGHALIVARDRRGVTARG